MNTYTQAVSNSRSSKEVCTQPLIPFISKHLFPSFPCVRRRLVTFEKLCRQDNSVSWEQLIKVE